MKFNWQVSKDWIVNAVYCHSLLLTHWMQMSPHVRSFPIRRGLTGQIERSVWDCSLKVQIEDSTVTRCQKFSLAGAHRTNWEITVRRRLFKSSNWGLRTLITAVEIEERQRKHTSGSKVDTLEWKHLRKQRQHNIAFQNRGGVCINAIQTQFFLLKTRGVSES